MKHVTVAESIGPERAEVVEMSEQLVEMLRDVRRAFDRLLAAPLDEAHQVARRVHEEEHAILERMVRPSPGAAGSVSNDESVFVPMHLERIADHIELLGDATRQLVREGVLFTDRATREMRSLFEATAELLEALRDGLRTGNRTLVRYVVDAGRACEQRANELGLFHEQRLIEGVCLPRASSAYLAMLDAFRGMEWHARQIAEKLQVVPAHRAE